MSLPVPPHRGGVWWNVVFHTASSLPSPLRSYAGQAAPRSGLVYSTPSVFALRTTPDRQRSGICDMPCPAKPLAKRDELACLIQVYSGSVTEIRRRRRRSATPSRVRLLTTGIRGERIFGNLFTNR